MCFTRAEQKGRIISLELVAIIQPRSLLTFFITSVTRTSWCPPGAGCPPSRCFVEAPNHVGFTDGWSFSIMLTSLHLLKCMCLKWAPFNPILPMTKFPSSTSFFTLYFPTQSITSSLDWSSYVSLVVPSLTHPHQHGKTVGKDVLALLSKVPPSLAFPCSNCNAGPTIQRIYS